MQPYMLTKVVRRIFIVPLANDRHGKSTLMLNFVNQAARASYSRVRHSPRTLWTPSGKLVDSYIFVRSFQETLKPKYGDVAAALNAKDPSWRSRELIMLPSHADPSDCAEILAVAQGAGFDVFAFPVLLSWSELAQLESCLKLGWDQRWTILNSTAKDWRRQSQFIASDLWGRVSRLLVVP